jgi:hypothetical protein
MDKSKPVWAKFEQRLAAEPIISGSRTLQPVAQVTGLYWAGGGKTPGFAGALAQVRPLEIIVREGEEERTIPIANPAIDAEGKALRAIVLSGMMVSLFCWFVMFVAQRFARRR